VIGKTTYAAENNQAEIHMQRVSFANNFANIVLAVISDQKKTSEQRKENLGQAFSKSLDIDWIAKFVVGRSWNNASDEQREQYTELYREFLTKTYVENFAENPDKRISAIKILTVSDGNDNNFTVTTQIDLTNQDTLSVNYLVREKEGRYKVLDIAIENVSLINTHRNEFTTLATNHGLDGVIAKLTELVNQKPLVALSMK
jgi:phospholipid transport system substrate-binding protein